MAHKNVFENNEIGFKAKTAPALEGRSRFSNFHEKLMKVSLKIFNIQCEVTTEGGKK